MTRHCALITARGNNRSLSDKNLALVGGKPSLQHVIEAAQGAGLIAATFVSTEDPGIRDLAQSLGCGIIDRPAALAHPDANHGDVIRHGVEAMLEGVPDLDCVCVLLGNTIMVGPDLIDLSLRLLDARPELDGVMSVWQAQDDHPYRALRLDADGHLESFLDIQCGTSRQGYPPVYYYDQGVWTFRHACVFERSGPNPWWWMGRRCFPIVRNWVTGRDFHSPLDLEIAEEWLRAGRRDEILNRAEIDRLLR